MCVGGGGGGPVGKTKEGKKEKLVFNTKPVNKKRW